MDKYNFKETETLAHKQEHKELEDQVIELKKSVELGEKTIDEDVLGFLNLWLVKHIMGTDKKLGKFLEGRE